MKKLPPLNTLRIFLQASRCKSFTQTASKIHLTKGAVSHQIKMLEDWLDVRLFIRNNDGIELTRSGMELKKTCETVFYLLEEKVYSLKNKTGETTKINIGCSASLLKNIFFQNQKKSIS